MFWIVAYRLSHLTLTPNSGRTDPKMTLPFTQLIEILTFIASTRTDAPYFKMSKSIDWWNFELKGVYYVIFVFLNETVVVQSSWDHQNSVWFFNALPDTLLTSWIKVKLLSQLTHVIIILLWKFISHIKTNNESRVTYNFL